MSGAVLWFTGLSGAGKSTLAEACCERLQGAGVDAEWLDGDVYRNLTNNFDFSPAARIQHLRSVAFLAAKLSERGVIVCVSFISPYSESRDFARSLIPRFAEIYVSTPQEVCEQRDPKGLYAKARRGEIQQFTGVDAPYEIPGAPEVIIDASRSSVENGVDQILHLLSAWDWIPAMRPKTDQ